MLEPSEGVVLATSSLSTGLRIKGIGSFVRKSEKCFCEYLIFALVSATIEAKQLLQTFQQGLL